MTVVLKWDRPSKLEDSKELEAKLLDAAKNADPRPIKALLDCKIARPIFINATIIAAEHKRDANIDLLIKRRFTTADFLAELKQTKAKLVELSQQGSAAKEAAADEKMEMQILLILFMLPNQVHYRPSNCSK